MADNLTLNAGAGGATLASDDVGGFHFQRIKVTWGVDGTATDASASNPLPVVQTGTLNVGTVTAVTAISNALPTGTNNIGDVDVLTVPTDPFGANADAASATGSISAKLRFIAATGIPITGTVAATQSGTWNIGSITTLPALVAGTANIGDVDVLTVPTDPFGANADAASATGSISAKLRFIAATGIPITGTVTVGSHAVTNAGTFVTQENGGALTSLQLIDDTIIADDAAFTVAVTKVTVAGYLADETSTDSVDEGDAGAARMTLDRKTIITAQPHTQGGTLVATGSITATATSIKASAGQVYGWYFYNPNASVAYVQFFNTASGSVTLGTTPPVYSLGIPATSAANVAMSCGIQHTTAIVIGVTTTRAGSTSPGSSVDYNVLYL